MNHFMPQIDCLLPQSIDEIFEKWNSDSRPALKLKSCHRDLDFGLPKTMGGLKTTGLEEGIVL